MDACDLASLLIRCYLSPAAETWETTNPQHVGISSSDLAHFAAQRWDPIKMAVGVAAGWCAACSYFDAKFNSSLADPPSHYADHLISELEGWATSIVRHDLVRVRCLILDGGATGKGGFRGRLAAELVNLGY